jgi:hypothetical protein
MNYETALELAGAGIPVKRPTDKRARPLAELNDRATYADQSAADWQIDLESEVRPYAHGDISDATLTAAVAELRARGFKITDPETMRKHIKGAQASKGVQFSANWTLLSLALIECQGDHGSPQFGVALTSPDGVTKFAETMRALSDRWRAGVSAPVYKYESWSIWAKYSTADGRDPETLLALGTSDLFAALAARDKLMAALRPHFVEVVALGASE